MIVPAFGYCHKGYRLLARSRMRFIQPDRVSPALAAAASYRALRSGESRNPNHADSPLSRAGLPLGLFGLSMAELCINK
jgi:hypothetical protein